jgi:Tol biopolymer transport system component
VFALKMAVRLALIALLLLAAAAPAEAAFPGRNGRVAYLQGDVGSTEDHGISTETIRGSGLLGPLGPACAEFDDRPCPRHPTWSPDGRRIAFGIGGRIGIMDAGGGNQTTLSFPGIAASRPAWSAAGDQLLFHGRAGGVVSVYIADADGSDPRRLTRGSQPSWTPIDTGDTPSIIFVRNRRLHMLDPDGTGLRRLRSGPAREPDASPIGRQLVFVRNGRIYRMRFGGRPRRVIRGRNPVWTPDGRWIVFDRGNDGFRAIYRVRPNGTGLRSVTTGEEGRRVQVFEPDVQPLPR